MITVEIDDRRVDLDPSELPGFYFALQDLLDLSAIKGSRSTTMTLPASNQVRNALGGTSMAEEASIEDLKFRVLTGSAILFSGRAKVLSRSMSEYELSVIGDNAAWVAKASELQLRDIELGYSPLVTRTYQKSTWEDEDSVVTFPLIDYGGFRNQDIGFNVLPQDLRPALRIWLLLKHGFASIGYSIQAYRSLAATWKKFILPNTTSLTFSIITGQDNLQTRMYETPGTILRQTVSAPGDPIPTGMEFPEYTGNFYQAPGRFEPLSDGFVAVSMRANWKVDLWTGPTINGTGFTGTMIYVLFDFTDSVIKATVSRTFLAQSTATIFDDSYIVWPVIEVVSGHSYGVGMYSPETQYMNAGSLLLGYQPESVSIYDATEVRWLSDSLLYAANRQLVINTAAPEDMTLLELLKWWTTDQNIVVRTDELTHHIRLEYYDDFCRPTSEGIDWTYRVDHTDPPRKVTDVLPKSYQFRFTEDDKDELVEIINRPRIGAPYGGHDHIVVGGQDSPEVVSIGFAPTAMANIFDGLLLVPCLYDNTRELDDQGHVAAQFNWKPRILYMDGLANGGWTYDSAQEVEYPRCYFVWPEQGRNNLSFGNETLSGSITPGTVATRWRNRLRRSTAPTFEGFLKIYDGELMGFDFGKPVYLHDGHHGSWFYFVDIRRHQFISEGTTEAKLVRM